MAKLLLVLLVIVLVVGFVYAGTKHVVATPTPSSSIQQRQNDGGSFLLPAVVIGMLGTLYAIGQLYIIEWRMDAQRLADLTTLARLSKK